MDYASKAVGTVKDMPVLNRLIEQTEKATSNISAAADRLDQASGRLLNPEPQGISKDTASDPSTPITIESYLINRVRILESLGARLHSIADRFDRAV